MNAKPPNHVYISGPMRNYLAFNFPAFFEAEAHLRELWPEADFMNPAREDVVRHGLTDTLRVDPSGLTAGLYLAKNNEFTPADLRDALGYDFEYICHHADLMVLLPGWEESKGARAEVAAADAIGIPVLKLDIGLAADEPVHVPEPESSTGEVRATSATGGQKGVKLAAFDQINPQIEWELAEHFGKGARKYAAHNFRKGYPWSLSYASIRRHLAEFWSGHEWDVCPPDGEGCQIAHPDTGQDTRVKTENGWTCYNHTGSRTIIAALWHAMALAEFSRFEKFKEYDDRYVYDHD